MSILNLGVRGGRGGGAVIYKAVSDHTDSTQITAADKTALQAIFNSGQIEFVYNTTNQNFYQWADTGGGTFAWAQKNNVVQGPEGDEGPSGRSVYLVFRNGASAPTVPTGGSVTSGVLTPPTGWTLAPTTPPTGQRVYTSWVGYYNGTLGTYSNPIASSGRDGTDGDVGVTGPGAYHVFQLGTTAPAAPTGGSVDTVGNLTAPTGWSETELNPTGVQRLYRSTALYHNATLGSWQTPIQFSGHTGAKGNTTFFIFRNLISTPAAPSGGSVNSSGVLTPPTNWSLTPSSPASGQRTYISQATYDADTATLGSWSTVIPFSGLDGQGSITQVTAGTGLTGGGSSGNVTVGIEAGGVGATELADDCIGIDEINATPGNAGQVLKIAEGGSSLEWATDSEASGDITSVIAGTGLTGGGNSGDVTVALDTPVAVDRGGTGVSTAQALYSLIRNHSQVNEDEILDISNLNYMPPDTLARYESTATGKPDTNGGLVFTVNDRQCAITNNASIYHRSKTSNPLNVWSNPTTPTLTTISSEALIRGLADNSIGEINSTLPSSFRPTGITDGVIARNGSYLMLTDGGGWWWATRPTGATWTSITWNLENQHGGTPASLITHNEDAIVGRGYLFFYNNQSTPQPNAVYIAYETATTRSLYARRRVSDTIDGYVLYTKTLSHTFDSTWTAQSISTANLGDDVVTQAKIAAGAVGATELADGSVTTDKVGGNAITTAKIIDDAVTTAKIINDAVTGAKIPDDAIGIEHINATGQAAGLVLTVNATNDGLEYAAAPEGDVTGITAGDGLTGGGNAGNVTVALDTPVDESRGGTGVDSANALTNLIRSKVQTNEDEILKITNLNTAPNDTVALFESGATGAPFSTEGGIMVTVDSRQVVLTRTADLFHRSKVSSFPETWTLNTSPALTTITTETLLRGLADNGIGSISSTLPSAFRPTGISDGVIARNGEYLLLTDGGGFWWATRPTEGTWASITWNFENQHARVPAELVAHDETRLVGKGHVFLYNYEQTPQPNQVYIAYETSTQKTLYAHRTVSDSIQGYLQYTKAVTHTYDATWTRQSIELVNINATDKTSANRYMATTGSAMEFRETLAPLSGVLNDDEYQARNSFKMLTEWFGMQMNKVAYLTLCLASGNNRPAGFLREYYNRGVRATNTLLPALRSQCIEANAHALAPRLSSGTAATALPSGQNFIMKAIIWLYCRETFTNITIRPDGSINSMLLISIYSPPMFNNAQLGQHRWVNPQNTLFQIQTTFTQGETYIIETYHMNYNGTPGWGIEYKKSADADSTYNYFRRDAGPLRVADNFAQVNSIAGRPINPFVT